jgi:thymidylate kinase
VTSTVVSRAAGVHPLLAAAFAALDREQLRWCLLRGEGDLDGSAGDVDLLVAAGDLGRAQRALREAGFARLPAWGHGSHAFFLAYHEQTDRWLCLDVVTDVRFGRHQSLRVAAEAELLGRREVRNGVSVLPDGDAFWMLLLHCLLDKDAVPAKHRARLVELLGAVEPGGPLVRALEAGLPAEWTVGRVLDAIDAGSWADLDALGGRLRRELTEPALGPARLRVLWNRSLRAASKVRRLIRLPGVTVALLGPDGSGKSTLADGLRASFPSYEVRVVYMGLYRNRPRLPVPGVYLASRVGLAWARFLEARLYQAAGRVVVLDRYVHDSLLPPSRPLGRLQRAHRWLVGHALPRPDLVLVLDVPGATAAARRPEEDAASLERHRAAYLELSARLRGAHVLDASEDADAVRRRAVAIIWSACSRRLDGS